MNKIGVKKEIDRLGRICIPKDMRKLKKPKAKI
jgi:bifunctional DNA-binding transcriptional regulator/antitoxin component of YhaV-PrlF toxin-antitoxin module